VEREAPVSSPWVPVIGHVGMVQSCTKGGLDWTLGSLSLLRGWSNTGMDFLGRWSTPQAGQCLRGIWTMSLMTLFNLVSPVLVRQWQ